MNENCDLSLEKLKEAQKEMTEIPRDYFPWQIKRQQEINKALNKMTSEEIDLLLKII